MEDYLKFIKNKYGVDISLSFDKVNGKDVEPGSMAFKMLNIIHDIKKDPYIYVTLTTSVDKAKEDVFKVNQYRYNIIAEAAKCLAYLTKND